MPIEQIVAILVVAAVLVVVITAAGWWRQTPNRAYNSAGGTVDGLLAGGWLTENARVDVQSIIDQADRLQVFVEAPVPDRQDEAVLVAEQFRSDQQRFAATADRVEHAFEDSKAASKTDHPTKRNASARWWWVRNQIARGRKQIAKGNAKYRVVWLSVGDPETSAEALGAKLRWAGNIRATVTGGAAVIEAGVPPDRVRRHVSVTKGSGKNRRSVLVARSPREVNQEYSELVVKHARRLVDATFKTVPGINTVTVSLFQPKTHALRGHEYRACVFSSVVTRAVWDTIVHSRVDPESAFKNFDTRLRRARDGTLADVTSFASGASQPADAMDLDPTAFELHVTALLQRMGMSATTTGRSGDGGIDIDAWDEDPIRGGRILVQCKRYSGSVGSPAVRDLLGAVTRARAMKGILITTGSFTRDAQSTAEDSPITLIDGHQLKELLLRYGLLSTAPISEPHFPPDASA